MKIIIYFCLILNLCNYIESSSHQSKVRSTIQSEVGSTIQSEAGSTIDPHKKERLALQKNETANRAIIVLEIDRLMNETKSTEKLERLQIRQKEISSHILSSANTEDVKPSNQSHQQQLLTLEKDEAGGRALLSFQVQSWMDETTSLKKLEWLKARQKEKLTKQQPILTKQQEKFLKKASIKLQRKKMNLYNTVSQEEYDARRKIQKTMFEDDHIHHCKAIKQKEYEAPTRLEDKRFEKTPQSALQRRLNGFGMFFD